MDALRFKAGGTRSRASFCGRIGRQARRCAGLLVLGGVALAVGFGCSQKKQRYKPPLFATESDAVQYIQRALEHGDADVRRGAIEQIGKTRHASLPVVVDGLVAAARADPSESVRCAAVRVLGKLEIQQVAQTMLVLLEDPARHPAVRPAGADLRWEAIQVLHGYAESEILDQRARDTVSTVAIRLLLSDRSRDVRVEAARLLGLSPTSDAVRALIEGLRQRDFAVVYESERSLMRLTGKAHDHDPARWENWLNATPDPFADCGELDDRLDPRPRRRWWSWKRPS